MKRTLACIACAATVASPTLSADPAWGDYNNTRFGFYVSYPKTLVKAMPEAGNGDGREFHARSGTAKILAYGEWEQTDTTTPKARVAEEAAKCQPGQAPYIFNKPGKPPLPGTHVVSCVQPNGTVLYYKLLDRKDTWVTFEATYPSAEKATWDPVIAKMSQSFTSLGSPFTDQ